MVQNRESTSREFVCEHEISKLIEQRTLRRKIFARWYLAIAITSLFFI